MAFLNFSAFYIFGQINGGNGFDIHGKIHGVNIFGAFLCSGKLHGVKTHKLGILRHFNKNSDN